MSGMTRSRVQRADVLLPTEGVDSRVQLAATVVADPCHVGPRVVCFAFPGGGYGRAYFDLEHPELSGPGQAEYHALRGAVFIACDPYGGGDSTELPEDQRGLEVAVNACDAAVHHALRALAGGTLVDWLAPIEIGTCLAIGHSLGGMQLIAHQARHPTFAAIGVLGWSAVHTQIPTENGVIAPHADAGVAKPTRLEKAWAGPMVDEISHLRFAYHWDDVSPRIVAEDMGAGFPTRTAGRLPSWITRTFPPFAAICMSPGVVAAEAAAVRVPVFVGVGERDVVIEMHAEASAYRGSPDVTLFEIARCAHMHNFSPQREVLWARLQAWIAGLGALAGGI